MKKHTPLRAAGRIGVTAVLAIALAGLTAPLAAQAAPVTRYVATTGSDTAAGTQAAPFKTIQKCASVAIAGDTCLINAGTYRETVKPANSGTAGNPITFKPVAGATVTIDGTDAVTGWTLDSGSIYKAPVALSGTAATQYSSTEYPGNTALWANQIFTGATMVPEASYPAPSANPFTQNYLSGATTTRSGTGDCDVPPCTQMLTGTFTYNSFPAFGNLTGAQIQFTGGWVAISAKVTSGTLTASNKTLNMEFPKSDDNVYPGGGNAKNFRIVGSKAFLTGANQWYYDAGAQQLYMRAANNAVPTNVFAKKRNYSFDLNSRSYINVTGIKTFANSITTNDSSSNIVLDGLNAQYLSHWQTAQYVTSLPLAGIYDANHRYDSGILLHGTNNTLKNSTIVWSSGNGVNIKGSGHVVQNNYIHDISYNGTYTAAVTLEVGANNVKILGNSLANTGRDVINMNTNLYPNNGYKNIEIGYNEISGYAKISYDLGGIYVCCDTSLQGSRIHNNRIHDPANTGNGIHLDNGAHDVTIDHNLIYNLKGVGDISHGGNGINFGGHTNRPPAGSNLPYLTGKIINNTIITGKNYTIYNYFANAGYVANTEVKNNILDGEYPAGQLYGYIAGGNPNDSNNLATKRSSNATGTDPQYNADFTIKATSPAVNAGVVFSPLTNGYAGAAPDQGAYETTVTAWKGGCNFTGCTGTNVGGTSGGTPSGAGTGGGTPGTGPIVGPGGLCVDNRAAATVDGNSIDAYTCNGGVNQSWTLTSAGELRVQGGCMTVVTGGAVQWFACGAGASQLWTATAEGTLVNSGTGNCLDLSTPHTAGKAIGTYRCIAGSLNQQWDVSAVGTSEGTGTGGTPTASGPIVGPGGLCVDNRAAATVDGNSIDAYTCNGGVNQNWTLTSTGELQVQGGCMTVVASGLVQWFACGAGTSQVWTATAEGTLVNSSTGKCLDLPAPRTAGTPIGTYRCITDSVNQQWEL